MKRTLDLLVTLVMLPLLVPLLAVVWVAVRVVMGPGAIYSQLRPGQRGQLFRIYKFRTMSEARTPAGELLPDEDRLTALGRFLRRTSLDELPESWNVLRSDMSLVGPRPLLPAYLPRYTPQQARRHEVKPGITGWAQVNGRNAISWEEKFDLDVWYVDNRSIALDMKILWLTLAQAFSRTGINAAGHATMPEFMGSETQTGEEGQ